MPLEQAVTTKLTTLFREVNSPFVAPGENQELTELDDESESNSESDTDSESEDTTVSIVLVHGFSAP